MHIARMKGVFYAEKSFIKRHSPIMEKMSLRISDTIFQVFIFWENVLHREEERSLTAEICIATLKMIHLL